MVRTSVTTTRIFEAGDLTVPGGHSLYDRTGDEITLDEVERIRI
jgi:hypothetical protein